MKINLQNLPTIEETTVNCDLALMQAIMDRVQMLCPKVEGEEQRLRTYDRDAGIEFRTNNYSFDLTISTEFRYGGKNEGRLPNGDIALRCPLKVGINWSGCGTRTGAETMAFAGRLMAVSTLAQAAVDGVVAGREVVQVYETAAQERARAESHAVAAIVRAAIEARNLGAGIAAGKAVRVTVSNEQFDFSDEGRKWVIAVTVPTKTKAGKKTLSVNVTVVESGATNVVIEIERVK